MIPLVLIPGMMCDARMWGGLPVTLFPREVCQVLPVDADSVEALATTILKTAPARFALAGLSMGGIVAMEVLRQAPDRVIRLALLDTNPLHETAEMQARRLPQMAKVQAGGLAGVMRDEMKPNYLTPGPGQPAILDLCMDMALALGPAVFLSQSRALANRSDQQETLKAFKGPALVLMGEDDRLCPRPCHDLMHHLMPQSRLVIIKGAAHLPPLEQPTQTTAALQSWLDE